MHCGLDELLAIQKLSDMLVSDEPRAHGPEIRSFGEISADVVEVAGPVPARARCAASSRGRCTPGDLSVRFLGRF